MKGKFCSTPMKTLIQVFINECEMWQLSKHEHNPIKIQLNLTPKETNPFEIVHPDVYTFEQNKFLTIIDDFFKYALPYTPNSSSWTETSDELLHWMSLCVILRLEFVANGTKFINSIVPTNTKSKFTFALSIILLTVQPKDFTRPFGNTLPFVTKDVFKKWK